MAVLNESSEEVILNPQAGVTYELDIHTLDTNNVYVYYGSNLVVADVGVDYAVELVLPTFESIKFTPTIALIGKIVTNDRGLSITVRRDLPFTTDFVETDATLRRKIAQEFDKQTMRQQQLARGLITIRDIEINVREMRDEVLDVRNEVIGYVDDVTEKYNDTVILADQVVLNAAQVVSDKLAVTAMRDETQVAALAAQGNRFDAALYLNGTAGFAFDAADNTCVVIGGPTPFEGEVFDKVVFERGSQSMEVDQATGLFTLIPVNTPRRVATMPDNETLGFYIGTAAVNLIEDFNISGLEWQTASVDITNNAGEAPDGTNTATLVLDNSSSGFGLIQYTAFGMTDNQYISSGFIVEPAPAPNASTRVQLKPNFFLGADPHTGNVTFDLVGDGAIINPVTSDPEVDPTYSIIPLPFDRYLIHIAFQNTDVGNTGYRLLMYVDIASVTNPANRGVLVSNPFIVAGQRWPGAFMPCERDVCYVENLGDFYNAVSNTFAFTIGDVPPNTSRAYIFEAHDGAGIKRVGMWIEDDNLIAEFVDGVEVSRITALNVDRASARYAITWNDTGRELIRNGTVLAADTDVSVRPTGLTILHIGCSRTTNGQPSTGFYNGFSQPRRMSAESVASAGTFTVSVTGGGSSTTEFTEVDYARGQAIAETESRLLDNRIRTDIVAIDGDYNELAGDGQSFMRTSVFATQVQTTAAYLAGKEYENDGLMLGRSVRGRDSDTTFDAIQDNVIRKLIATADAGNTIGDDADMEGTLWTLPPGAPHPGTSYVGESPIVAAIYEEARLRRKLLKIKPGVTLPQRVLGIVYATTDGQIDDITDADNKARKLNASVDFKAAVTALSAAHKTRFIGVNWHHGQAHTVDGTTEDEYYLGGGTNTGAGLKSYIDWYHNTVAVATFGQTEKPLWCVGDGEALKWCGDTDEITKAFLRAERELSNVVISHVAYALQYWPAWPYPGPDNTINGHPTETGEIIAGLYDAMARHEVQNLGRNYYLPRPVFVWYRANKILIGFASQEPLIWEPTWAHNFARALLTNKGFAVKVGSTLLNTVSETLVPKHSLLVELSLSSAPTSPPHVYYALKTPAGGRGNLYGKTGYITPRLYNWRSFQHAHQNVADLVGKPLPLNKPALPFKLLAEAV